jgi:hypothetical protein
MNKTKTVYKGVSMLRKIVTLICAGLIVGASAEESDKLDAIQKSLDKIMAKSGISIDGEFKSEYFSSKIGGHGANDSTARQEESNEFTSVDFDIKARPNDMVSARVIFRMHQNWQNFFSDISNPIFSRWISIDGNAKDMFKFTAGDFKQKYSSLTLYTPDVDMLYEPTIFSRQRQIAMDENFVGNNNRVLQGINLNFDAEVAPIFNEFHFGLIGCRLKSAETSIQNGNFVATKLDTAELSKYFVGSNLDMTFLKGVTLGGTCLYIFDQKTSYKGALNYDTTTDTLAQRTLIYSGRPGVDIGALLGSEALDLKIATEFAFSSDDSTWVKKTTTDTSFADSAITGSAIKIGGEAGYRSGNAWSVNLSCDYTLNSKDYRNELAQSPSFIGDRIMNIENGDRSNYSTFDALYHSVFKYVPASSGQYWTKSPFRKNSYWRSVFTQNDLAGAVADNMDPALQLVMPYGPATPNRAGISANLKGTALNNGIEVSALFSSLKEKDQVILKADSTVPKKEFSQVGAGVKVDLSKFIPVLKYPLEVSGSFVQSGMIRAADTAFTKYEIQSSILNTGLYYKFWKKTALLGGYQVITNKYTGAENTKDTTTEKWKLENWAVGLEWKVSEGADLVASYGQILIGKPDSIVVNGTDSQVIKREVYQTLVSLSLLVKF